MSASPPPPLPVYAQPPIPAAGYVWTPGYWAWGDDDYYWVPGTWVGRRSLGVLWTPAYWGCRMRRLRFQRRLLGTDVGFYGGINYGFGYGGLGYGGGYWRGNQFYYNRSVNNFGKSA